MKEIRKTVAFLLTAMIVTGSSAAVYASEDIPPAGSPEARGISPFTVPESDTVPPVDNPVVNAPPVYSIEDYQDMNDELADPVDESANSPAYGTRYGNEVVLNTPDDILDEESFPVEAASTIPQNAVPIADTDTTPANDTVVVDETTPVNNDQPNTGAANALPPILASVAALGAAPVLLRKRK